MNRLHSLAVLMTTIAALAARSRAEDTRIDLTGYDPSAGVVVTAVGRSIRVDWPIDKTARRGVIELSLDRSRPLITRLAVGDSADSARSVITDVTPCGVLTVGTRDLKPAGWTIFFDNVPKRPWTQHALVLGRESLRVVTEAGRTAVVLGGASAGPFAGEFRFTFYPGGRLVRAAMVMSTERPSTALLYDSGLLGGETSWKNLAYTGLSDAVVRTAATRPAAAVQVRSRLVAAEGAQGSVAIVPPPHQFFYPLDSVDNYATAWVGRDWRGVLTGDGFGVRQTIEGDRRWVPWMNAPPGSRQDLGVFYLLSDGDAAQATQDALAYTRGDRFEPVPGHQTFTSHYHVEHTIDFLNRQAKQKTADIPEGLQTPQFVTRFKEMGVNIVHLAELHLSEGDMKIADRLTRLKTMHAECRRLSDDEFLLLPGEEPNVHLGGHWLSLFPRPVYWTLDRKRGQPFVEETADLGKVYHVGNSADVLKLMELENGLMWTAHARIKASTAFPDAYQDTPAFKSPHFLGAAWKAMPADASQPRLGGRVLDLLDDMNNWGARKQAIGEVDVFAIDNKSELFGHMNVNYLRLDRVPKFDDGWQPAMDALRGGHFFTTTGEVLVTEFTVNDVRSGASTRPTQSGRVRATLRWTFPLNYAEVVSGDGTRVFRDRIDLNETTPFGERVINAPIDLTGRKWVRFEVWDVAANGAYTQPVWLE